MQVIFESSVMLKNEKGVGFYYSPLPERLSILKNMHVSIKSMLLLNIHLFKMTRNYMLDPSCNLSNLG